MRPLKILQTFTANDGCIFFVNHDFSAFPNISNWVSSKLKPFLLRSHNHRLRWRYLQHLFSSVTKCGAFTTIFNPTRRQFTTRVCKSFTFQHTRRWSTMGNQLYHFSSRWRLHVADLFVIDQNEWIPYTIPFFQHLWWSKEDISSVENCIPSTIFTLVSVPFALSMVIRPSSLYPIASAIIFYRRCCRYLLNGSNLSIFSWLLDGLRLRF